MEINEEIPNLAIIYYLGDNLQHTKLQINGHQVQEYGIQTDLQSNKFSYHFKPFSKWADF